MRILAIDTTAEVGSIALVDDGELVEEVALQAPDGFGQVLYGAIGTLLARHGLTVGDIDCFASATGPGTFTGVRIGLTAAKGLAESGGKRMAGVSNLRALAFYGETHGRGVAIDARRGDVYAAVYDEQLRLLSPEVVMPLEAWRDSVRGIAEEFVEPRPLAGAIGLIAAREGLAEDPAAVDANYVRRSDAEMFWKEA